MKMKYTELLANWTECIQREITEISDLNNRTFKKINEESTILQELMQIKKPEDFIAIQMKLATAVSTETMQYLQEIYNILNKETFYATELFTESLYEVTPENVNKQEVVY